MLFPLSYKDAFSKTKVCVHVFWRQMPIGDNPGSVRVSVKESILVNLGVIGSWPFQYK